MSETLASPAAPSAHKDRRAGLIVFGIVEILCGCLSALLLVFMILGQLLSERMIGASPMWRSLFMSAGMYGVLAVVLVWLGIGSFLRRRWARALSLILGWSWLLVGVFSLLVAALVFPSVMSGLPEGPPVLVFLLIMLSIMACPMVVVPAALVLFYGSRHVKATCEASDPQPGWTDACPLPVLAAALWMVWGGFAALLTGLSGQAAWPLFGTVLVGVPGMLACLPLASIWVALAWALYRLHPVGWWATLATHALFAVSSIVTFARIDLFDLYRQMGLPEAQIDLLRRMPIFTGPHFAIYLGVMFAAMIGYLLWIRRYFVRAAPSAADPLQPS
jgi:hypothetical protein